MKPKIMMALLVAMGCVAALAQKEAKLPDVGNFPFWTAKKGAHVAPFVPGLNAVLLLTDQQKQQIAAARAETIGSEAVMTAGRAVKGNQNATEAEKESARKTVEDARAQLDAKIAAILTPGQKALIEKINDLFEDVHDSVRVDFESKFTDAKGDPSATAEIQQTYREKAAAEFSKELAEILTAEQRAALKAAAEESQRAADAAGKKKAEK